MSDSGPGIPMHLGWLLTAVMLMPLVLAPAAFARALRPVVLRLAPWAPLPGLALAAAPDFRVELPWLLLGAQLGLDVTGRVFLTFTPLLWLIAGLYARSYLSADLKRHRFTAFYLVTMSGNLGVILSLDVASFYFFFALMGFAAYGLIVHEGSEAAHRAGRMYLILAIFGEILLFVAFVSGIGTGKNLLLDAWPSAVAASPARDLIVALLLMGFGVKIGALGLHVWLPLVYPAAPIPASAILSSAVIKAGLLGWLRFLPLGEAPLTEWGYLCVAAGFAAAFYGVAVGLTQGDSKTVLAYSSISQMGLIAVPAGLWLAVPAAGSLAWTAIVLCAVHHALAKGTLFLGVGVAQSAGHDVRRKRRAMAGLLLPSLALAGAPFTSGALAKQALKDTAGPLPDPLSGWLPWMLSVVAVGTTLLLVRFLCLVWREERRESHGAWMPGLVYAWGMALLGVLGLTWTLFPDAAGAFLGHALEPSRLWSEFWPLAIGVMLALLFGSRFRSIPAIPAGDLLVPAERWVFRLRQTWAAADRTSAARSCRDRWLTPLSRDVGSLLDALARWHSALEGLTNSGVFLLLLILMSILALLTDRI